MELTNAAGDYLKLTIVGYQFPHMPPAEPDDWDANWLKVRLEAVMDGRAWTVTDPCLTTWEVDGLAAWLDQLRLGQPLTYPNYSFTEPLLNFVPVEFGRPGQRLRIYLDGELRPPWRAGLGIGLADLWLDFPLAEIDLQAASARLRAQLLEYPVRTIG